MKITVKEIKDLLDNSEEVAIYDSNNNWVGVLICKQKYQIFSEALNWQLNNELNINTDNIIKAFDINPESSAFSRIEVDTPKKTAAAQATVKLNDIASTPKSQTKFKSDT